MTVIYVPANLPDDKLTLINLKNQLIDRIVLAHKQNVHRSIIQKFVCTIARINEKLAS